MFRGAAAALLLMSFLHLHWPHYDGFSCAVVITYCYVHLVRWLEGNVCSLEYVLIEALLWC